MAAGRRARLACMVAVPAQCWIGATGSLVYLAVMGPGTPNPKTPKNLAAGRRARLAWRVAVPTKC